MKSERGWNSYMGCFVRVREFEIMGRSCSVENRDSKVLLYVI